MSPALLPPAALHPGLLHPALPFVLGCVLTPLLGRRGRRMLGIGAPALSLLALWAAPEGASWTMEVHGFPLVPLHLDGLAAVFAWAFAGYALVGGVYAWTDDRVGGRMAQLGLAGAGLGVVVAGDLLTLFVAWEWLTVASLFLIWQGRSDEAYAAGLRYLAFHLLGAAALLAGILMRVSAGGLSPADLWDGGWAGGLILAGMLVNAAVPPLHAWLPDAYPRASVYGTVFLAAFTTKAAVYALIRGFAGLEILIWMGALMALVGVTFALLQDEMRRLLSYHIVSQVGYMVAGVGLGTSLSLNGASAHAFAHIFYKGLLLMGAGAVLHATGSERLSALGGLSRSLPRVALLTVVGAAAISGVPLLNGFVSKSMTLSAAGYTGRWEIFALLQLAAAGTFLSVGLKLPWFAFGNRPAATPPQRAVPASMEVAMALAGAVCLLTGLWPGGTIYTLLPFDAGYEPFTWSHFGESALVLGLTAVLFWRLRRTLAPHPKNVPDLDRGYRPVLAWLVDGSGRVLERLGRRSNRTGDVGVMASWSRLQRYGAAHRNPTVSLQTTAIVLTLLTLVIVGTLVSR